MTPQIQDARGWIAYCDWARRERAEAPRESGDTHETEEQDLDQHD